MELRINGESRQLDDGITLRDLVRAEGLEGRRVAIELNGDIVPRSQHGECRLADGDVIEIVHAIGGG